MEGMEAAVKQVLAGDVEAFAEVYNQSINQVYRTLFFLTENKADVDDIVQEVYVELFKNLYKYDSTRSFQAWLYGITIKQHQAYRRRRWRQSRKESKEMQLRAPGLDTDISIAVVDRMTNQSLLEDIETLSYKLKQVIILHYLNELTQEEISEALQIPLGTVKSRIHLALKELRAKVRRGMYV